MRNIESRSCSVFSIIDYMLSRHCPLILPYPYATILNAAHSDIGTGHANEVMQIALITQEIVLAQDQFPVAKMLMRTAAACHTSTSCLNVESL